MKQRLAKAIIGAVFLVSSAICWLYVQIGALIVIYQLLDVDPFSEILMLMGLVINSVYLGFVVQGGLFRRFTRRYE